MQAALFISQHCIWVPQKEIYYLLLRKCFWRLNPSLFCMSVKEPERGCSSWSAAAVVLHTTQHYVLWLSPQPSWLILLIFPSSRTGKKTNSLVHVLRTGIFCCLDPILGLFPQAVLYFCSFFLHNITFLALSVTYLKLTLHSNCSW